uniref:Adenylate kinase n=1 Tax=Gracilinema caldarium TaxID=215591 RepID=A0A7C3I303_9SPIR
MRLILFGAPGAGKGSQAEILSQTLHIPHISTGDIFRDHITKCSDIGNTIKKYIKQGLLVPDELTINILRSRILEDNCKDGFILDGFPRTNQQAEALDRMLHLENLKIDKVVNIHLEDDKIVERLLGRLTCSSCNSIYHVKYNKPLKDGICDTCGSVLVKRDDDTEATIMNRLKVYHSQTEQVLTYYRSKNMVIDIESCIDIHDTTKALFSVLNLL